MVHLLSVMKLKKAHITAVHDSIMAFFSLILASYLRIGDELLVTDPDLFKESLVFALVSVVVFSYFRIYNRSWAYFSTQDLIALVKAVTLTILIFLPVMFMITRLETYSRSVLVINWFVLLALLGGPRFIYRMIKQRSFNIAFDIPDTRRIPVLLVGLNGHTEIFLRNTQGRSNTEYDVVGIVDDNREGQYIHNVKVYGGVGAIEKVARKLKAKGSPPQKLVIAPDMFDGVSISGLLETADRLGLTVARLRRITDFQQAGAGKMEMRPIAVEDLLGRPQNALNRDAMRSLVQGKRIMVTGAGGTIGSELCRQIAGYEPAHITLFDNCEYGLYRIDHELGEKFRKILRSPVIGDIRDRGSLDMALKRERAEIIFHAAALKHVPMSELNPCEAMFTNIIGSKNVADAAVEAGVQAMVMISTDKAVNPANTMGATKRVAEQYINALGSNGKNGNTRLVIVRFGNVLGSTGSVIPLFKEQLEQGGPLTVTHPEITRYFMTVREAVELVLQASSIEAENQGSETFVLDMGGAVRIRDLAEQVITLAGLRPEIDIKIEYTGLRPGEKLYEELFYGSENPQQTEYDSIMRATPQKADINHMNKMIKKLHSAITAHDDQKAISVLKETLPEFAYLEEKEAMAG